MQRFQKLQVSIALVAVLSAMQAAAGRFDKKIRKFHQGHNGVYIDRITFSKDNHIQ